MLGLAAELPGRAAERVAEVLGMSGMVHQRARSQWASARNIRERSSAIVSVLTLLTIDQSVLFRVLGAGCLSNELPEPWLWSSEASAMVFPSSGTLAPAAGRCRPPPAFEIGSP